MPFNFYDTHTLLMAVQQLTPAATFLLSLIHISEPTRP